MPLAVSAIFFLAGFVPGRENPNPLVLRRLSRSATPASHVWQQTQPCHRVWEVDL